MSLLQAIFMGILQGITEFLPVSSSGHLALFKNLFQIETETGMLFDILLHFATLLAICVVYYKDIARLFVEGLGILRDWAINFACLCRNIVLFAGNKLSRRNLNNEDLDYSEYRKVVNSAYRKFVMLILMSSIPTAIIGFVSKDVAEQAANLLIVPGICWIVTAGLLFVADKAKGGEKLPREVTYTNAFIIGIVQGIATLPGISRSGATIAACLLCGFNRKFAVKYSFIMSIPAILGATLLELTEVSGADIARGEIFSYVVGMIFAAVVGYISIKTMLVVVGKKKFTIFSIYCLLLGLIAIGGYHYMV